MDITEGAARKPKRPGGEKRGNNLDRARRKRRFLNDPQYHGTGETCECVHCHNVLTYATVEADRKDQGGSYRYENVQPACRRCNAARSNNPNWVYVPDAGADVPRLRRVRARVAHPESSVPVAA